jgi:hypothetical protein
MFPAIATAASIGAVVYLWLTVSTLPIRQALRATLRSRGGHGWRYALPLAIGVSAIAAATASACAIVIAMCSPHAGALLGDPELLTIGVFSGLIVWCARAAALGAPRLSPDAEVALALAVVALRSDDAARLSTVERKYVRHVLRGDDDPSLPQVVRTVLGV